VDERAYPLREKTLDKQYKKMLYVTLLAAVPIVFSLASAESTTWYKEMRISNVTGIDSCYPGVASGRTGSSDVAIHIVWQDKQDGNWEVYYRRYYSSNSTRRGNWSEPVRISVLDNTDSQYPKIACNGKEAYIVWLDGYNNIYFRRVNSDGSLQSPFSLSSNAASGGDEPVLIDYTDGAIHVVWAGDTGGGGDPPDPERKVYYRRSVDGGNNWEAEQEIADYGYDSGGKSLAGAQGKVCIAWSIGNGGWQIKYATSTDNGQTWGVGEIPGSGFPLLAGPALAGDEKTGNGNIYMLYSLEEWGPPPSFGEKLHVRKWDGSENWEEDSFSSDAGVDGVSAYGDRVYDVYETIYSPSYKYLECAESTNGGESWSTPATVVDNGSSDSVKPGICSSETGTHLVWQDERDRDGHWEVYFKSTLGSIPQAPIRTEIATLHVNSGRELFDGEIVGVRSNGLMEAEFNILVDQSSVQNGGIELIEVKNNLNETINEETPLDFTFEVFDSSCTVAVKPSSGELKKNYLYILQVTGNLRNRRGNQIIAEDIEIPFRTVMDHTRKNVITKETNERLIIITPPNALNRDGYIIINTNPLTYQEKVDDNAITSANDKLQGNGEGFQYPLDIWEFCAYYETGDEVEDFNSIIEIRLPYADNGGGMVGDDSNPIGEETLLAFWLNEEHANWVKVPDCQIDSRKNFVTIRVIGFSVYALIGSPVYDLSEAHAYPVPWKPNDGKDETGTEAGGITFTNLSSQGVIKVFTISGELVMEHEFKPVDKGKWTWDVKTPGGKKVFSGVYIYCIKNEMEQKVGRLMIIR